MGLFFFKPRSSVYALTQIHRSYKTAHRTQGSIEKGMPTMKESKGKKKVKTEKANVSNPTLKTLMPEPKPKGGK